MGVVRSSNSTTVEFRHGTTAAELSSVLADIPPYALVSVTHYEGDQRDPSYTRLTFTWDPRRG